MIQDWVLVTNEYILPIHCTEEEVILAATEAGGEYFDIAKAVELGVMEQADADWYARVPCLCCP